jgi:hypothetical protein
VAVGYYSGKKHEESIFDDTLSEGTLSELSISSEKPYQGTKHLLLSGTGQRQRASISGIQLDISDFAPESSYLEMQYDQGTDATKPVLYISGIGSTILDVDDRPGYEKIIVPFHQFRYVTNRLDRVILRGEWKKGTKVYLDSITVCNSGSEKP